MALAGARPIDQHDVALLDQEAAADEIAHQGLVDRAVGAVELGQFLGHRQLGDGHLVRDRAGLLLDDLGFEQVADDL